MTTALWNIKEISQALSSSKILNHKINENTQIKEVVIDSRKVKQNSLFIALKGENTDGHKYLNQVFENGASLAIVEEIPDDFKNSPKNLPFIENLIVVKDTYEALNKLAIFSRNRTQAKIIAITGSVGKTSTKELLKLAFSSQGKTFANIGNLNNHIGLPLSIANLEADCDFAIFEMGMNHLNEIKPLSKIARPHVAIITNVGPVHIEFFKNELEIALAKSEIFAGLSENGIVILNSDNKHFEFIKNQALQNNIKKENIFSVGIASDANYKINKITLDETLNYNVSATTKNNISKSYIVGTSNISSAFNSIFALSAIDIICNNVGNNLGNNLENNLDRALDKLKDFQCSAGRGKITNLIVNDKKITIIDDTYNASILSMKSGIENCINLKKMLNKKRIICAIGDMLELGEKTLEIHTEILKFVAEKNFDKVILVGKNMINANNLFKLPNSINYPDSTSASVEFASLIQDGDLCYFKGSRGTKMEIIIQNLNS